MSMNNKVQQFLSETFGEVRALKEGDVLWFCGYDVAKILGYANPSKTISSKVSDLTKTVRSNNNTNITMISEKSLYRLIFGSKMEKAEEFQNWICETVIPTLRKDGMYVDGEEDYESGQMSEDEFILRAMTMLQAKVDRVTKERDEARKERDEAKTEVNKYASFVQDKMEMVTKAEFAKRLSVSTQRLASILKQQEVYTSTSQVSQKFLDYCKCDSVIIATETQYTDKTGNVRTKRDWQWSGEGCMKVLQYLEEKGVAAYKEDGSWRIVA